MELLLPFLPLASLLLIFWYVARRIQARNLAAPKPEGVELYGVGGWLALFIYGSMSLAPLTTISQTFTAFLHAEDAHPQLLQFQGWHTYKAASWVTVTVMLLWQIFVAWELKTRYAASSARRAKLFLLLAPALYAGSDLFSAKIFLSVDASEEGVASLAKGYVSSLIWFWYLSASERVRNTYYTDYGSDSLVARAAPQLPPRISDGSEQTIASHQISGSNVEERLTELRRLFELKLISAEDFDLKKQDLLSRL